MNIDRREAIKRVAGAAAVAGMGGTAMAMGSAPAVITTRTHPLLRVCKGGSLRYAYCAARGFSEKCAEYECESMTGNPAVNILKTHPEDTKGFADPFHKHSHHVNVIMKVSGRDEPLSVNFIQLDMTDGSSQIFARTMGTAFETNFVHDIVDELDATAFGASLGERLLSVG